MEWWRENVVWWSSPESRRAGKVSVFACAETVVAVTATLWFAQWTGIWTPVLISLAIAPLVLLRSDASVETAYQWFEHDHFDGKAPPTHALWAIAALSAAVSGAATYGLALWLLADTVGLRTFWIGFGLGVLALNLGIAIAGAVAGVGVGVGVGVVAAAVAGVFAVAVAVAVAAAVLIFPGFFLVMFLRALACRIGAALVHWRAGLAGASGNWTRILFQTDTAAAPELLPTPGDGPRRYTLTALLKREVKDDNRHIERPLNAIGDSLLILICLPSVFYRLSIKSTAWLYAPLLYLAIPHIHTTEERRGWLNTPPGWGRWLGVLLAAILAAATVWGLLNWPFLFAWLPEVWRGEAPFSPVGLVYGIDLGQLDLWQWLPLAAAITNLVLFFWAGSLRRKIRAGVSIEMTGWPVGWLVRGHRLLTLLVVASFLGGFFQFAHWLHTTCDPAVQRTVLTTVLFGPHEECAV